MSEPSVACICLTRDRPQMAARAVRCWQRQTYPSRLMILDSGTVPLRTEDLGLQAKYSDGFTGVHVERGKIGASIGLLRNEAISHIAVPRLGFPPADIIVHWDDDDWSHPNRIAEQVALLQSGDYDAVGYREMLFWYCAPCSRPDCRDPNPHGADGTGAYLYTHGHSDYCIGTSLMYRRRTWVERPFADLPQPGGAVAEDHVFQSLLRKRSVSAIHTERFIETSAFGTVKEKMAIIDREPRMIATIHGGNSRMGNYTTALETGNCFNRAANWDSAVRRIMEEA